MYLYPFKGRTFQGYKRLNDKRLSQVGFIPFGVLIQLASFFSILPLF